MGAMFLVYVHVRATTLYILYIIYTFYYVNVTPFGMIFFICSRYAKDYRSGLATYPKELIIAK